MYFAFFNCKYGEIQPQIFPYLRIRAVFGVPARRACVVVSDWGRLWCVLSTSWLCVLSAACAVRVVGSVSSWHVDAAFSRRAARVGADVKDGERCVWCSRMWCWLFGCVHHPDCVCGAIRACQFASSTTGSASCHVGTVRAARIFAEDRMARGDVFVVLGCGAGCCICESFGLCVACFAMASSTGLVTCHVVGLSFSWQFAVRALRGDV